MPSKAFNALRGTTKVGASTDVCSSILLQTETFLKAVLLIYVKQRDKNCSGEAQNNTTTNNRASGGLSYSMQRFVAETPQERPWSTVEMYEKNKGQ